MSTKIEELERQIKVLKRIVKGFLLTQLTEQDVDNPFGDDAKELKKTN